MCISNPTQIWNAQATYKRAHIYSLLWAWESEDNLWFSSKTHAVLFTLQLQVVHIQSGGGGDPIVHMCSKQAMGTKAASRCRSSNEQCYPCQLNPSHISLGRRKASCAWTAPAELPTTVSTGRGRIRSRMIMVLAPAPQVGLLPSELPTVGWSVARLWSACTSCICTDTTVD